MSRPKAWWYSPVVTAIRQYPKLIQEEELLSQREHEIVEAVDSVIAELERDVQGQEALDVARLYHWVGIRNFEAVGDVLHMSRNTAKRRNGRFVRSVAQHLGYR